MQVTRVVEQRIVSEERIKIKIWKLWNKESSLISESNCKYMEVVEQRIVCDGRIKMQVWELSNKVKISGRSDVSHNSLWTN